MFEPCSLTDEGRRAADEISTRYWEAALADDEAARAECRRRASAAGLEQIATGSRRTVFAVADELVVGSAECVLKIPHELFGYLEHRAEVASWKRMPEEARRHVAPIWERGEGWHLLPRAETDVTSRKILEVWSALSDAVWYCENANWGHNIGRVDGRPVVLDYGRGCFEI